MKKQWLLTLVSVVLAGVQVQCGSSGNKGSPSGGDGGGSGSGSGGSSGSASGGSSGSGSGGSSGSASGGSSGSGSGGSGSASGGGSGVGSSSGAPTGSVLQRGNDVFKRATYVQPGLSASTAPMMMPDTTFNTNASFLLVQGGNAPGLDNNGVPAVLYLTPGPAAAGCPAGAAGCLATARAAGAGVFFAFAPHNSKPNVLAFDESTGLAVWTAYVTPGGDGIRGTPVIDQTNGWLYAVTGNGPHMVHRLSVETGVEVTTGGWPVTLTNTTLSTNGAQFNSSAENQHGASLLLPNGIMYIPFGGEYGDGGNYLGWIVAVNTTTTPPTVAGWATKSSRSGIWGSGGLASDGTNVFGATGDTAGATTRENMDSEEVVSVTGMAVQARTAATIFVPTEWQNWDRPNDLDFGASTPAWLPLPAGSTPAGLLIAPAKAGRLFVLNGENLSQGTWPTAGGQIQDLTVANTGTESVYTAPTIYNTSSAMHVAINVGDTPMGCPAGTPNGNEMVESFQVSTASPPQLTEVWCSPNAGGGGHHNYPPISTTTDDNGSNALVWYVDNVGPGSANQLTAVDGAKGPSAFKFTTTGAPCDNVPSMSWPIAVNNRIVVVAWGGDGQPNQMGHLCSWSLNGD